MPGSGRQKGENTLRCTMRWWYTLSLALEGKNRMAKWGKDFEIYWSDVNLCLAMDGINRTRLRYVLAIITCAWLWTTGQHYLCLLKSHVNLLCLVDGIKRTRLRDKSYGWWLVTGRRCQKLNRIQVKICSHKYGSILYHGYIARHVEHNVNGNS